MNYDVFSAAIAMCALGCLFILWELGFRLLFLEDFRDSLFVVRDRLYALAQQDLISCDSPEYRSVEILINGLIRFAHRFSFLMLVRARVLRSVEENSAADDFAMALINNINAVQDTRVRTELQNVVVETGVLLSKYIAKGSFCLIVLSAWRRIHSVPRLEKEAVSAIEREAYNAYASEKGYAIAA